MKKWSRRKTILTVVVAVVAVAALVVGYLVLSHKDRAPLNTDGALVSLTQGGDTIVFNADGTYAIQGDVEVADYTFDYDTAGTYAVTDGTLVFNEESPTVSVSSQFGDFDMPGSISSNIEDGALVIRLDASNENDTFELAVFHLGRKEAEALGIKGVTADSWSDDGTAPDQAEPAAAQAEPELDANGALLTVESAGDKIAFFPDGTFKLVAHLTQSLNGQPIEFNFVLEDQYQVENGVLILPANTSSIMNSDLMASYGRYDMETPTHCSAKIVDGLLELRFVIETNDGKTSGEEEIAVFKIGQADAEKIGVAGVTGDTVIEQDSGASAAASQASMSSSSNSAPYEPAVAGDARPLSFSNGAYTITFYSNGQYKESGTVYAAGTPISVTVTDTYSIDGAGRLSINTGNQVSCYLSFQGHSASFGVPNSTSCSGNGNGYTISFDIFANGQMYHVGSVILSAQDLESIKQNYGLSGDKPEPTPAPEPSPAPEPTPTPEPEPTPTPGKDNESVISLTSDSGMTLVFHTDSKTFDVTGKTAVSGIDLASYSLVTPGTFSAEGNVLTLSPATLRITALNDMAKRMEGDFDLTLSVAKGENNSLVITLPIGDPAISFELTEEQAKKLGIDVATYAQKPDEEEPSKPYTPDESKTVIEFAKDNGTFYISGAGTFNMSGVNADLSFSVADSYSVTDDGSVTASNTENALSYTVSVFGQTAEAKTTPQTSVVKDGDNFKVVLAAEVNGQTITLCEGEVPADKVVETAEAEKPDQSVSYTPSEQQITFDAKNGKFTASGSGTLSAMGMDIPLTFSVKDGYCVSEGGDANAANASGALEYSAMGAPGTTDPITTITKEGDGYRVKIVAVISGQSVTLLDQVVSADEVIAHEPDPSNGSQPADDPALEPATLPSQDKEEEAKPAEPSPQP